MANFQLVFDFYNFFYIFEHILISTFLVLYNNSLYIYEKGSKHLFQFMQNI